MSLPARGAWIEMGWADGAQKMRLSLPARGAWIEITNKRGGKSLARSLPARGAWIEITAQLMTLLGLKVAPRTGSVD